MAVKIVVDTGSDITLDEADLMGVYLLPMEIKFKDGEYYDGVNLSHKRFFEKLIESDDLPKTSQINEFRFQECFSRLSEDGSEVLCITLSSALSGTFDNARKAAEKFDGKVFVVDSLNATIGERILFEYALRLVKQGIGASEAKDILDRIKGQIKLLALVGTLTYLKKGGRVSKTVAFAGELLNVKPVVSVENGEVKLIGKALGSKKGNNLLNRLIENSGGIDFDMPYAVAYSGLNDAVLLKYLSDSEGLYKGMTDHIPSYMIGSTIGTHVGPGAIAVAFFAKGNR